MDPLAIDWTPFDNYPENTATCRCGAEFRSHTKYVVGKGIVTRKPCPGCDGVQSIWKTRSDPETMTIGAFTPDRRR